MDWSIFISSNWTPLVDWLANDIHNSSQSFWSYGDFNRISSVCNVLSSHQTFSGIESDGSNGASSQMLGDFKDQSVAGSLDFEGIENWWKFTVKLDINDGSDNLGDSSNKLSVCAEQS